MASGNKLVTETEAELTDEHRKAFGAIFDDLDLKLDKKHHEFSINVWKQGARFCVVPAKIPLKGTGMVAARDIQAGESIAHIPTKLLYTTNKIPSAFKRKHSKSSIHGLLAAALLDEYQKEDSPYRLWFNTWPSIEDLETSMPTFVTKPDSSNQSMKHFQALLPPAIAGTWCDSNGHVELDFKAGGLLAKQEAKIARDWSSTVKAAATTAGLLHKQAFKWMWLMVNTRCFYYDMPLRLNPKSNEEKMCLCPFLDYFNHDSRGCNVAYNDRGFEVTASRAYSKGEEVVISYGAHSNDLLWTDYGFFLNENEHDSVCIDAWVLDPTTGIAEPKTRRLLENAGYWRNYTLSKDGPCYRTQMAIRTQVLNSADWQRLARGESIETSEADLEQQTGTFLKNKILKHCINTADLAQSVLTGVETTISHTMFDFAMKRWQQIRTLAEVHSV